MKYSEDEYKNLVANIYNGEVEIVGKFLGLNKPILIKNKYGVMKSSKASLILNYTPTINIALNKTEYAMNMLKEKHFEIYSKIRCVGEYKTMKTPTLFETSYGLVKTSFDTLLAGHMPGILSAINRKEYFKNQLKLIYGDKYDFKITSTNRHGGKSILVCPIHGEVLIDNDYIFTGKGCPKCNNITPSTTFYFIKIEYNDFQCYKIGISYRLPNNQLRRYNDYRKKGYKKEVIKEIDFNENLELKQFELKIKKLIKNSIITPPNWDANIATECFSEDLFDIVLNQICMI